MAGSRVCCDTAYDATKLIALAIEEVGEYDGAAIEDALYELGVGYSCAGGTITWDENGDRVSAAYGIWELQLEGETEKYEYEFLYYISF